MSRSRQILIWVFAGYLVLLLNLGPSLHHAHFFGFHTHSGCADAAAHCHGGSVDSHYHETSCCAHDNGRVCDTVSPESTDSSLSDRAAQVHSDHDCQLCKFFEHYQVVLLSWTFDNHSAPLGTLCQLEAIEATCVAFEANARGPPRTTV